MAVGALGKLPEFAIMPEKYPSTRSLQPGELIEGSQHCLAVMETLRQPTFAQGPAEIAGISGKDDIARGQPYSQRLVS
jgi:hypothetical protein